MRKIIVLMLLLLFSTICLAQEKVGLEDKLIASTFKTLAKAYVSTVDIQKLKETGIEKVKKLDGDKFNRRYAQAYMVVKDLPPKLKATYAIAETMSKEQAIKNMQSLDKKKMNALIEAMPDKTIAKEFKDYLNKQKTAMQDSNIMVQINTMWNKIISKINPPET